MVAAYEALSPPLRHMLEGMTAIHDGDQLYRGRYGTDEAGLYLSALRTCPVVRTFHPVSRRKTLYVNRLFTTRIVQLSKL